MSGGHFNYDQYHIKEIKEELELMADDNFTYKSDGETFERLDYVEEKNRRFVKEAIVLMIKQLEITYNQVQALDYLISGDTGAEKFLDEMRKGISSLHKLIVIPGPPVDKRHLKDHEEIMGQTYSLYLVKDYSTPMVNYTVKIKETGKVFGAAEFHDTADTYALNQDISPSLEYLTQEYQELRAIMIKDIKLRGFKIASKLNEVQDALNT